MVKVKMNDLIRKYKSNQKLINNVLAAFFIKGSGLVVSIISLPLYINYFDNRIALGVWFTMLTLVGWILSFDIGVGNGLRNKLTIALSKKDYDEGKKLVSSSYVIMGVITIVLSIVIIVVCSTINWNTALNIETEIIDSGTLTSCISIIMIGILGCFFFQIVRGQIYALQLSSVNNFLQLSTHLFMVGILFVLPKDTSIANKFTTLSVTYVIIINLPYVIATILIHKFSVLKNCSPSLRYISKESGKAVVGLGLVFFAVQILHMFINVSNEMFITTCFNPKYCVDYQVYFRIFSLLGTLIMITLTPLWSAITKAYAEKRYKWIYKLNKFLSLVAVGTIVIQCLLLSVLQPLINLWLGDNAIKVDYLTASFFLMYSAEMIWVSVQSTIVAGLGELRTQLFFYIIAVIIKVSLIIIISSIYPDGWMCVVLATALGLLPYCIIQPVVVSKLLKQKK